MPFNPCGRPVDFGRRPYTTLARFFKDRPDILIPIQWYPADPKAPRVPWSSSFLSLDWTSSQTASNEPNFQDEPWLQRPGEVFDQPRPYNGEQKKLGLKYDHVCGTEAQFAEGAIYDPTLNVQYDEQGLPLCCNGPAVPFFGLVMGFDLIITEVIPVPPSFCDTATPIHVGDIAAMTLDAAEQATVRLEGTPGESYVWNAEWVSGVGTFFTAAVFAGTDCAHLAELNSAIGTGPFHLAFTWPADKPLLIAFIVNESFVSGATHYRASFSQ